MIQESVVSSQKVSSMEKDRACSTDAPHSPTIGGVSANAGTSKQASAMFVRSSKFRHVYGTPFKRTKWFENIKVNHGANDYANICKVNPLYLAVNWESSCGGTFAVIPHENCGRISPDMPLFIGHSGPVLDFDFSPFDDNLIASCSEDLNIMLWKIPPPSEAITTDQSVPLATLSRHSRKVVNVLFHPSAQNVLASSGFDPCVLLWDVEKQKSSVEICDGFTDNINSFAFNYTGNVVVSTCRDKKIRMHSAHTGNLVAECDGHQGAKGSRIVWLGDSPYFTSVGFSKRSERQFLVWDSRNLHDGPVQSECIDSSSGLLMPFFDPDTSILYLAGKGDGNIRYYEFISDKLLYISEYQSNEAQKGMGFMPKRGVTVPENEINILYKVCNNHVEPISFKVPRRSERFQPDIFIPTASSQAALSAEEFFAGKFSAPLLDSYNPSTNEWSRVAESVRPVEQTAATAIDISQKKIQEKSHINQEAVKSAETSKSVIKATISKLNDSSATTHCNITSGADCCCKKNQAEIQQLKKEIELLKKKIK